MALDTQLIANLEAFRGVDDLERVLADARSVRFKKNSIIFEQDAPATSFYLLLHGRVRAYRVTADGQQIVMRFVGPGELFGVAMAIGTQKYPANTVAVVDSVALVWPTSAWDGLTRRFPALLLNTLRMVGGRLQEVHSRMTEMATEEVPRRVANTLLRLALQAGRKTDEGVLIDFPITRQDIAHMSSTTLHTVSRLLSAWEQDGLVLSSRQRVILRDPHRIYLLTQSPRTDK